LPLSAVLAMPLVVGGGPKLDKPETHEVVTTIEIDAPPEKVWPNVVGFSELPPPSKAVFHTGVAYPQRARMVGTGPGAVRHCEFSTGAFVEPSRVHALVGVDLGAGCVGDAHRHGADSGAGQPRVSSSIRSAKLRPPAATSMTTAWPPSVSAQRNTAELPRDLPPGGQGVGQLVADGEPFAHAFPVDER